MDIEFVEEAYELKGSRAAREHGDAARGASCEPSSKVWPDLAELTDGKVTDDEFL